MTREGGSLDERYYGDDITLLDLADRALGKGVCIAGDIVISVADVDLVYLSLRALLASVDTAMDLGIGRRVSLK